MKKKKLKALVAATSNMTVQEINEFAIKVSASELPSKAFKFLMKAIELRKSKIRDNHSMAIVTSSELREGEL